MQIVQRPLVSSSKNLPAYSSELPPKFSRNVTAMDETNLDQWGSATRAIYRHTEPYDPIEHPSNTSTTFHLPGFVAPKNNLKYQEYCREGHPNAEAVEKRLAAIEGGKYAFVNSAGQSSLTTLMSTVLSAGDHVLVANVGYANTTRVLKDIYSKFGIAYDEVDFTDLKAVERKIKPKTKMLIYETPNNPLLQVVDIKAVSNLCKKAQHRYGNKLWHVVDNTFATPVFQKPLSLGADVSLHSLTKYASGQNNILAGGLVLNDKKLKDDLTLGRKLLGTILGMQESHTLHNQMSYLGTIMPVHESNAQSVAQFLEKHPAVEKVIFPGLDTYTQKSLKNSQMSGNCGMLALFLKPIKPLNDQIKQLETFSRHLKLVKPGQSLGGAQTMVTYPYGLSFSYLEPDERIKRGIKTNLLRVSVGRENARDIINDLNQALNKTYQTNYASV